MNTCSRIKLRLISALANGPVPFTVCQMLTADTPRTASDVTCVPAVTAAATTTGKTTYSSG